MGALTAHIHGTRVSGGGAVHSINNRSGAFLFKDLIRAGEKGRWDFDAKRFGGLEINSKQVLGGLFNR